jgi:FkbM family methyltransferase
MFVNVMSAICKLECANYRSNKFSNRVIRYGARMLLKVVLPLRDPLVKRTVRSTDMLMPLSHMLPKYTAEHPYYDTLLPALAKYLSMSRPIVFVDIGANIGDTTRLVDSAAGGKVSFICIEAGEAYFRLLEMNTKELDASYHLVLAGAETKVLSASAQRNSLGITSYEVGRGEAKQVMRTDDIIGDRDVDIIKIDTDGFELEVLKGMTNTVAQRCSSNFRRGVSKRMARPDRQKFWTCYGARGTEASSSTITLTCPSR